MHTHKHNTYITLPYPTSDHFLTTLYMCAQNKVLKTIIAQQTKWPHLLNTQTTTNNTHRKKKYTHDSQSPFTFQPPSSDFSLIRAQYILIHTLTQINEFI